jgi:hypothetical protein
MLWLRVLWDQNGASVYRMVPWAEEGDMARGEHSVSNT